MLCPLLGDTQSNKSPLGESILLKSHHGTEIVHNYKDGGSVMLCEEASHDAAYSGVWTARGGQMISLRRHFLNFLPLPLLSSF